MRGGQHQVLLLMRELRHAGHDSLLLARAGAPLGNAARAEGFEVQPAKWKEVRRRSASVDLVHAHDAHAHTTAAIGSRRPFIVSRRVAFPVKRSILSKWKYARAVRFISVSRFVAQLLAESGIASSRIDVIYDAIEPVSSGCGWTPEGPAVALASTDPQKGRELVESAAHLTRVKVLFSDNLQADLQRASMFVYVTKSEGLGSAALLALSLGVPVIASRVGGLPEIIEDGVSGILVENEPKVIAAAMDRLFLNERLAEHFIEQGRSRIQSQFTLERLREETIACYRRALAR